MFCNCSISSAAIKQIVADMHAEGSKVVNQERNMVLVALAGEGLDIGQIFAPGEADSC